MDDLSLNAALRRDETDLLAAKKSDFMLPDDIIYLDGNSLGPLTKSAAERLHNSIHKEWGDGLIRSWNDARWIDLPREVGARIAPIIGAQPDNVVMADSTSVNLFKLLSAALDLRPGRLQIVTERDNFPTDNYIAEGVIRSKALGHRLIYADNPEQLAGLIDDSVAVVLLTHVNYRNGYMHDMAALTAAAHDAGAVIIWDLAHSAGAVPLCLDRLDVDFAIGCSYKYLNGGPGAPAFLYVSDRHIGQVTQPLSGWFAHRSPFSFEAEYEPADDINQFLCGTSPILSAVALDAALSVWQDVDIQHVREKSLALTDYFIALVEMRCEGSGLKLITPTDHAIRGSQVSLRHPDGGYAIMAALIANGVIGDFRSPDILRFGFTPLYTSFTDVWKAVDILARIMDSGEWNQPQFHARKTVT